jgi:DNA helicase-2/ATP-dependent DNA helicase PcrA
VQLIADLHIHSRFSRATSRDLDFVTLHRAALEKGIGLVGSGDLTHPGWMAEIEEQLEEAEEGLFRLKPELARAAEEGLPAACGGEVRFVLQVEISNIYKLDDRVRKNHNLVYVPTIEAAHRFTEKLSAIGNVTSDGRPILGLDARDLLEITLEVDPQAFLVPAHIWTPWFSMLGSKSGFDSIEECYRDLSEHVFAAETGLSSDPPMNWRLSQLDRLTLVSSSDAHSAAKLGREANLFDIEPSYPAMLSALKSGKGFLGTIEFYPEEGKYHLDGHRKCELRLEPEQTRELGGRCPTCGGKLTVGVMSRVLDLADRPPGSRPKKAQPFTCLVPLDETVGQVLGVGPGSKKVRSELARLRSRLGPDLAILRDLPLEEIGRTGGAPLAEAVRRVREGELSIAAGYDGEFGTVSIFSPGERAGLLGQMNFFTSEPAQVETRSAPGMRKKEPVCAEKPAEGWASSTGPNPDGPLAGLDPAQLSAATATSGPLLVVAGPGSGKTRTVVARIAHQILSGTVRADQVLAISFTNQAAEELQERIIEALQGQAAQPQVTTFHGLGRELLAELSVAEPNVIGDQERLQLVSSLIREGGGARQAETLLALISLAKQSPVPEAVVTGEGELEALYSDYQAGLAERELVDIDDLVLRPYQMLRADPYAAEKVARRYASVSVDEYQDVNDVQAALVELLAPGGATLCAIGDPNQAIYGFRGARPGHFIRFAETFPGAQQVSLATTYRLSHEILAAARTVVPRPDQIRARHHGPPVEVVACPTPESEAEQILIRLERIIGGSSYFAVDSGRGSDAEEAGVGFGDMAVLCRTKAQRSQILKALGRSSIPCRSVGSDEAHDPRAEKVAVMTMHAAKGREFEVVFIAGVEPGLVPLRVEGMLDSDEEEERRLLYVAITRARRLAVLSHARRRSLWGRQLPGGPSPFLADLPRDVVRSTAGLPSKPAPSEQLRLF